MTTQSQPEAVTAQPDATTTVVVDAPAVIAEVAAPMDHTATPAALEIPAEPATTVVDDKPAVDPVAVEVKPEAPVEGVKPEDAPVTTEEVAAPEAPIEYDFTFPEGFSPDNEMLGSAIETMRELKIPPEAAQKLLDHHIRAITGFVDSHAKAQADQWQQSFLETRKSWQAEAKADPVIGGAAWKTSVGAANDVIANTAIIPKSDREAFNTMLRTTGVGDHPQFIKMLNRINSFFTEPSAPPPAQTPPRGHGTPAGSRRSAVLDHPTSHQGS